MLDYHSTKIYSELINGKPKSKKENVTIHNNTGTKSIIIHQNSKNRTITYKLNKNEIKRITQSYIPSIFMKKKNQKVSRHKRLNKRLSKRLSKRLT